jgi:hypothetical protein
VIPDGEVEERKVSSAPEEAVESDLPPLPSGHRHLGGREAIIMTPWGPWDHASPLVRVRSGTTATRVLDLLGFREPRVLDARCDEAVSWKLEAAPEGAPPRLLLSAKHPGLLRYRFTLEDADGKRLNPEGEILVTTWAVCTFAYDPKTEDPRTAESRWRARAFGPRARRALLGQLDLRFGMGGPDRRLFSPPTAALPRDHFGTLAHTRLTLPGGALRRAHPLG